MPALNAEPLADSSRGRATSDAPSTKYALLAGECDRRTRRHQQQRPDRQSRAAQPGDERGEPRRTQRQRQQHRPPQPDPPGHRPRDHTAGELDQRGDGEHEADRAEPQPQTPVQRDTDMYGSTAKLPSVIRNEAASSARWAPLSGVRPASPRPFPHRRTGPTPASGAPSAGCGSSVRPHTASATTGSRTAALHARCCASSAVAPSASTIPVQPR
ncbi:hypothetical protein SCALM49S_05633 [Streptomyces californicus]